MRIFTTLLALFICQMIQAQSVPLIKIGEDKLGIKKLDVSIVVTGNIATTTYDMQFYNPTRSILEGELVFPLGEKQSVSRFALDVNGKIREAVVVEKEQGRIAFEAVVRRRVDPALLEKGTGNNYRARIYPIPARGYKRVILAYEEELTFSKGAHFLRLHQNFESELENYSISVIAENQTDPPIFRKGKDDDHAFNLKNEDYTYVLSKQNYIPASEVLIELPQPNTIKTYYFDDTVYAYKTLDSENALRVKPKKIQLLWDVSLSMEKRDIEKEFEYLDSYFTSIQNVEVELSKFSNTIGNTAQFTITNGNWEELKKALNTSVYDGGTSYNRLLDHAEKYDEIFLFTDGLYTLSTFPKKTTTPIFVVNSLKKANHADISTLTKSNTGRYINLFDASVEEAIEMTRNNPLYFLGYTSQNQTMELYPKSGTKVYKDFSIVAKGVQSGEKITLQFGNGGLVLSEIEVIIPTKATSSDKIQKMWAKSKVSHLQVDSDKNKNEIVQLGKKYGLITDHTSLIVLELARDYFKYDILPPEELMAEYLELKKRDKKVKVTRRRLAVENNEDQGITDVVRTSESTDEAANQESNQSQSEVLNRSVSQPSGEQKTITGTVTDENNLPLPGVNIIVAGTSNGTQSDFDGNYRLNVREGEDVVYSYLSYSTLETTVGGSSVINIKMEPDAATLSEVVVTGFAIKKEKKALGYAVTSIQQETIEESPQTDFTRVLSGKAAGVQITSQNGISGSANKVVIRGANSFSGNNNALYVIDGVPYSNDTNTSGDFINGNMASSRSFDIDPNNIARVDILKGLAATTLYGSEGRNGVILITTKSAAGMPNSWPDNTISAETREKIAKQNRRRAMSKERTIEEKGFSTNYLRELEKVSDPTKLYSTYLKQRAKYAHLPAYFIDVYDHFKVRDKKLADRILSNVSEIDMDNYELLKVFAYKLEEQGNYELAVFIYRQVLKLRSEDSQSYRDLALALQEIGQPQEAIELLNSIASGALFKGNDRRNFKGMASITINEIRNMIHRDRATYDLDKLPYKVVKNYDMDIRVVVDWNHNDTDIDLHIIDPNLEECSYQNVKTKTSGELSRDMTQGFGPEEFKQKFATKGAYYVKVNYFGDRYQKVENPTFLKMTVFRNYGRPNQSKEVKVLRLSGRRDKHLVDRILI